MDFMKDIVVSVKVDEMYNILKFASHCFLVERWRWNLDDQSFSWNLPLNLQTFLRPSFIKGTRVRVAGSEKELDITYRWHWSTLVQRSKKIEMGEKLTYNLQILKSEHLPLEEWVS